MAGCGEIERPFRPDDKAEPPSPVALPGSRPDAPARLAPGGPAREAAEYVVEMPSGGGEAMASRLAQAIVVALRDHGIVAATAPASAPRRVRTTLKVQATDSPERVAVVSTFTVSGPGRATLGEQSYTTVAPASDWLDGNDRLVSRIAQRGAFRVAEMLGRADVSQAPPGARQPPALEMPSGVGEPPPGTVPVAAAGGPGVGPPKVRVATVTGAPSDGNRSLTSAMRRALGESEVVIVDGAEAGAMTLEGAVTLTPPAEGRQRLTIRWVLKDRDGRQIGDLEQGNPIRAGSLDKEWGGLAHVVAMAAAEGVMELIVRARAQPAAGR